MFDDLSGDDVKESVDVATGLLGQIGFIGSIALAGSFLGVCLLCSLAATGKIGLEIFIMFSLPLTSVPLILAYINKKKEVGRDIRWKKDDLTVIEHAEKTREKMTKLDWIKKLFAVILFTGIICGLWAAVMIGRADPIIGGPEVLTPSYKATIYLLGIMGLIMINLFIVASLIISHKEEAKKTVASRGG